MPEETENRKLEKMGESMELKINREKFDQIQSAKKADKKHTILVVDDELSNLESLVRVLEQEYNVLTADDGLQAWELVKRDPNPGRIHCIISDQRMPHLNGVEFLEKTIPIIPKTIRMILTGYTDLRVIVKAINKGYIYKFMTKPVEPNDFLLTVKRALEAYELIQKDLEKSAKVARVEKRLERETNEAFISSLSHDELHWFMDALKGIIQCDQGISGFEMDYLRTILSFVKEKEEAQRLVKMIKEPQTTAQLSTMLTLDRDKGFDMLTLLLKFAMVDGIISEKEIDYLRHAGGKIGFDHSFCARLLDWATNRIEIEDRLKRFRADPSGFHPWKAKARG